MFHNMRKKVVNLSFTSKIRDLISHLDALKMKHQSKMKNTFMERKKNNTKISFITSCMRLTLSPPTPQNGQTHSNNSSARANFY